MTEQKMCCVTINGEKKEYPAGISYWEIAKDYQGGEDAPVILVTVNGKLRELHKHLKKDCTLGFVTTKDAIGHNAYVRSATFILLKAIYDVAGKKNLEKTVVHYALGNGLYFTMEGGTAITEEFLVSVKKRMEELVKKELPIVKRSVGTDEAIALFHKHHMYDKEKLFRYPPCFESKYI